MTSTISHDGDRPATSYFATRVVAEDRDESEPCQAGTPGCCIDHIAERELVYVGPGYRGCDTW